MSAVEILTKALETFKGVSALAMLANAAAQQPRTEWSAAQQPRTEWSSEQSPRDRPSAKEPNSKRQRTAERILFMGVTGRCERYARVVGEREDQLEVEWVRPSVAGEWEPTPAPPGHSGREWLHASAAFEVPEIAQMAQRIECQTNELLEMNARLTELRHAAFGSSSSQEFGFESIADDVPHLEENDLLEEPVIDQSSLIQEVGHRNWQEPNELVADERELRADNYIPLSVGQRQHDQHQPYVVARIVWYNAEDDSAEVMLYEIVNQSKRIYRATHLQLIHQVESRWLRQWLVVQDLTPNKSRIRIHKSGELDLIRQGRFVAMRTLSAITGKEEVCLYETVCR
jgi:hypothetical protein